MFSISVSLQSVVCFRAAVGVFSPVLVLFSIAIHSFVSRAAVGDFLLSYLFLFLAFLCKLAASMSLYLFSSNFTLFFHLFLVQNGMLPLSICLIHCQKLAVFWSHKKNFVWAVYISTLGGIQLEKPKTMYNLSSNIY